MGLFDFITLPEAIKDGTLCMRLAGAALALFSIRSACNALTGIELLQEYRAGRIPQEYCDMSTEARLTNYALMNRDASVVNLAGAALALGIMGNMNRGGSPSSKDTQYRQNP